MEEILNTDQNKNFFQKNINIIICCIFCTALWGSAFPCVKLGYELFNISVDDIFSKILFAGWRFFLAGIIVLLITACIQKKFPKLKKEAIKSVVILGFIQTTLEYIFFYIGLSYASGFKGAILNPTSTFMMVILAHFFYKDDKLTFRKTLGCIVGFLGIIIVNLSGDVNSQSSFLGEGCLIISALAFAIGSIISKEATKIESNPMIVTGYQLLIGGFILIVFGLIGGGKLQVTSTSAFMLFLYLALLSSIAFSLWTTLFKYNPVSKVSIFNFLTPIFGTILSALILSEDVFNLKNISALILVCFGIYIVNKPKTKNT
ncbi:MAG: DMT family transporter [Clostridiales bacterium]|jgi:drug/metabolite transporter (DMT)-like permease|uniref:DMT family transporter n=1 Tax=Clostridium sp. 2218st1_F5_2218SCRN_220325 TaxID=3143056 RepID=UPI0025FB9EA2|nr:DMT family transporter [uncultured Intestinibacter sp.]MDU1201765.1 DMT family transporter [Clostridiales bacterium]